MRAEPASPWIWPFLIGGMAVAILVLAEWWEKRKAARRAKSHEPYDEFTSTPRPSLIRGRFLLGFLGLLGSIWLATPSRHPQLPAVGADPSLPRSVFKILALWCVILLTVVVARRLVNKKPQ
jgi:hypothetical protein